MKALLKRYRNLSLAEVPTPQYSESEALIEVLATGICRTDVYVAYGKLPSKEPLILGHEFSGRIAALGGGVLNLKAGQLVTAMPIVPCGACSECLRKEPYLCQFSQMLGVQRDGSFAQYVAVPAELVTPVPENLSPKLAACAEPVAAALAVATQAQLKRNNHILVAGRNRISTLVSRVLKATGFDNVVLGSDNPADLQAIEPSAFDVTVESSANPELLKELVRLTRPKGTIVIKSRFHSPLQLDFTQAVRKELTFKAVNYAPFGQAVELLSSENLVIEDLIGGSYSLNDYESVLEDALRNESSKLFFTPEL